MANLEVCLFRLCTETCRSRIQLYIDLVFNIYIYNFFLNTISLQNSNFNSLILSYILFLQVAVAKHSHINSIFFSEQHFFISYTIPKLGLSLSIHFRTKICFYPKKFLKYFISFKKLNKNVLTTRLQFKKKKCSPNQDLQIITSIPVPGPILSPI